MEPTSNHPVRRSIRIRGIVQAVGFRPAIFRLAHAHQLGGLVRNERGSVWIEVEGAPDRVSRFLDDFSGALPAPARVDALEFAELSPRYESRFCIESNATAIRGEDREGAASIPADLAPCDDCLRELFDPGDRRHRHPFIGCTACGPRYTIVRSIPFDRERTTMDPFIRCAACRREYEDPLDRRFHSQASSCPDCGPKLWIEVHQAGAASIPGPLPAGRPRLSFVPMKHPAPRDRLPDGPRLAHAPWIASAGQEAATAGDALSAAALALRAGAIVAVKGAGGFALACDAQNHHALTRLRARKRRPHKPFAVMARDIEALEAIALVGAEARAALTSPARPIVLLPLRQRPSLSPLIAPGLAEVGAFLPPTPLQHLLAADGPPLLVMTSGNRSSEPMARTNEEARAQLEEVADALLLHDREICAGVDDSVIRIVAGSNLPIRRARGFVPDPIELPIAGPPLLAVGAGEKNTICLAASGSAHVSAHLGDLDDPAAYTRFRETIDHLSHLHGVEPQAVAHDLHPDLRSTRWAQESGLPLIPVQHHHAHVASCLVEHRRTDPVVAIAFDGMGLGGDGSLWGGEILLADLRSFRRLGHLRALALPGGEAAIRAPWRSAMAALLDAGEAEGHLRSIGSDERRKIRRVLDAGLAPLSTGAGRWFDAVAALCGLRTEVSYDGQAPAELEAAAAGAPTGDAFDFEILSPRDLISGPEALPFEVDLRPTIRGLVHALRRGAVLPTLSARFHSTMARIIQASCRKVRAAGGPATVALVGGCFQNRRLTEEALSLLEADGFEVLRNLRIPPNDGGISLGQAAIASCLLSSAPTKESIDVPRDPR